MGPIHPIFGGAYWLLNILSGMVFEFVLVMVLLLKSGTVLGCPLKIMAMSRPHRKQDLSRPKFGTL